MQWIKHKMLAVTALAIVLTFSLALIDKGGAAAFAAYSNSDTPVVIKVNGAAVHSDVLPFLHNGRVMVPLRIVSEAMGAKVTWNASRKTAVVVRGEHQFELSANEVKAVRNGNPVKLDTAPVMREGRLFIPLRFSAEGLGGTVRWNQALKEAKIYPDLTPEIAKQEVGELAEEAIHALFDQNFDRLAKLSHSQGVTFSPYGYVDRGRNVILSKAKLAEGFANSKVYEWGSYDGSGETISMNFETYFHKFIYNVDFAKAPFIGFNESMSMGNTVNNVSKAYSGSVIVEYHFTGFKPEYAGIDWQSLRLVLQRENGNWVLSGVVHDQWTI
ncbi:copper amine oxidase N-terminal domain-containing protein [Paenibacillus dakarensis]|uniref:copper amine oxidase N-terminal domain-containing protein n=1 Tax=Paenibacillus dakarensis TaxID=1527293 RepID=UPI000AAA91E7|nr:copper amine oxidase N-terminal domain-containing protein [Paenibacillus dakarensis]